MKRVFCFIFSFCVLFLGVVPVSADSFVLVPGSNVPIPDDSVFDFPSPSVVYPFDDFDILFLEPSSAMWQYSVSHTGSFGVAQSAPTGGSLGYSSDSSQPDGGSITNVFDSDSFYSSLLYDMTWTPSYVSSVTADTVSAYFYVNRFPTSSTVSIYYNFPSDSLAYSIDGSFSFNTSFYYGCYAVGGNSYQTSTRRVPYTATCLLTFSNNTTESFPLDDVEINSTTSPYYYKFNLSYDSDLAISTIRFDVTFNPTVDNASYYKCYTWMSKNGSPYGIGRYAYRFGFKPNFVIDTAPPKTLEDRLNDIQDTLDSINDKLTSSDEQNAASQAAKDKMGSILQQIEDMNKVINDNTNRPNPGDVVTGLDPSYFNPTDPAASEGLKTLSTFAGNAFFISFMIIVLTLALMRYILYGKR